MGLATCGDATPFMLSQNRIEMKPPIALVVGTLTLALASCHSLRHHRCEHSHSAHRMEDDDDDDDERVALEAVPAAAKQAALRAVPGFVLEEAELESRDPVVYCLHGHAGADFYEVETTAEGKIVEIESGYDGDDDADENDGDED